MRTSNFPGRKNKRRKQALAQRKKDEQRHQTRFNRIQERIKSDGLTKKEKRKGKRTLAKVARKLEITKREIETLEDRIK